MTARSGQEALELGFQIYTLFRQLYEEEAARSEETPLLDFGCGWGRVTRFFLKDVAPGNLMGVDIDERAITAQEDESVVPVRGVNRAAAVVVRGCELRPDLRVLRLLSPF